MVAARRRARRDRISGPYYIDYWLTDAERVDRDGDSRYVVIIRDSLRVGAWVFRFAYFDSYVERIVTNLNRKEEDGE